MTHVLLLLAFLAGAAPVPGLKLQEFPLSQVRLLDGRFKIEQERDLAYLRALDSDRLLFAFRKNAGIPTSAEPYGGWEEPSCEVRGHFTGHFLSACAMMYASTGDADIKAKADAFVAELAKVQQALGGEYLSAFPEEFFDRVEAGRPVWVPYYTLHKIMAGLYDVHVLCGNQQALDVLKGMTSYIGKRVNKLPNDAIDRMLRTEFGGMSEVLHNVYGLTGDPAHLELANKFDQPEFLGPLALGYDNLTRIHGNTNIPKVIGAARRWELTGDARYRDLVSFFWDRVVGTRTYATGGSTIFEIWPEPDRLVQTLGNLNHETCKTHNILKVTEHLLSWTGDVRYADFYERGLYNGILGTQGPEPGQLQYYVAMGTGFPRAFGTPDKSFWCCYGTGIESFAKIGGAIFLHDESGVYVNLFAPAKVDWPEKGVTIEQRTRYPEEEETTLILHCPREVDLALNLRVPGWIAGPPEVRLNGATIESTAQPGSWRTVTRAWKDGDTVTYRMPMRLRTMALPDDPRMVAVLYGPVVLAGIANAHEGEPARVHEFHEAIVAFQESTPPYYFVGDPAKPEEWLAPVDGKPLTFKSAGQPFEISFMPFMNVVQQAYGLYFPVVEKDSDRHRELQHAADRHSREIDRVFLYRGEINCDTSDRVHNLKHEKSGAGCIPGTSFCWRDAQPGGNFGWELKVDPERPAELVCTYWSSDTGRSFDVLVDGQKIATQSLDNNGAAGRTFDVIYPIPAELTTGKQKVRVTFDANHDTMAGGVFGLATLRQE